jgi:hypothetical protein
MGRPSKAGSHLPCGHAAAGGGSSETRNKHLQAADAHARRRRDGRGATRRRTHRQECESRGAFEREKMRTRSDRLPHVLFRVRVVAGKAVRQSVRPERERATRADAGADMGPTTVNKKKKNAQKEYRKQRRVRERTRTLARVDSEWLPERRLPRSAVRARLRQRRPAWTPTVQSTRRQPWMWL